MQVLCAVLTSLENVMEWCKSSERRRVSHQYWGSSYPSGLADFGVSLGFIFQSPILDEVLVRSQYN